MEQNEFNKTVDKLKKLHLMVGISLMLAVVGFLIAPISTYFAEGGTPYFIKSGLMVLTMTSIPLLYWLYNKNVIEADISAEERQESFLRWSYVRMAFWSINVLLCLLVYHFDTDALAHKTCSSLYLCVLCLLVYLFLGRIRVEDLNKKDK